MEKCICMKHGYESPRLIGSGGTKESQIHHNPASSRLNICHDLHKNNNFPIQYYRK